MNLSDLLEREDWSEKRLVDALRKTGAPGVNQSTINRLKRGRRTASLGLALAIERATAGLVKAEDVPLTPSSRAGLRTIRRASRTPAETFA